MNGILILDKPSGWTSNDVVVKLRGALREKRIGHGGTLDPMATGVLPVFVGRATRAVQFCENAEKEYLAGFLPGLVTDTQDITGTVLQRRSSVLTEETLRAALPRFLGPQLQLPPMYSAVKINGRPLYKLARKGIETERQLREITVSRMEYTGRDGDSFLLRIVCSKGTYIRTLCADLGEALGCGGVMSSLRRLRAGRFSLDDALPLESVLASAAKGEAETLLLPLDSLFEAFPAVTVDARREKRIRDGVSVPWEGTTGRCRVYGEQGDFLMLADCADGILTSVKNFF